MGLLGETKPVNKLVITIDGDDYEFSSGGGTPGPNTVGTEQIIDGAVETEDLNEDVKEKMTHSYDAQGEGIKIGGFVANGPQTADAGNQEDNFEDD